MSNFEAYGPFSQLIDGGLSEVGTGICSDNHGLPSSS